MVETTHVSEKEPGTGDEQETKRDENFFVDVGRRQITRLVHLIALQNLSLLVPHPPASSPHSAQGVTYLPNDVVSPRGVLSPCP